VRKSRSVSKAVRAYQAEVLNFIEYLWQKRNMRQSRKSGGFGPTCLILCHAWDGRGKYSDVHL
jgi:hypothetical protein